MPDRFGTVTLGGPSETTTVTVVPSFDETPAFGLCDTMSPDPTVIDLIGVPSARFMCTFASDVRASATVRFANVGVGCDGVSTAARATPAITQVRRFFHQGGRFGASIGGGPPFERPKASASNTSPGPDFV